MAAIPYVLAAVSAYGAYSQSQSRQDMAEYQSKVAENNAKVAEWQAQDAESRGDRAAQETRRKYAALMGTQRAELASRGLDISDGSANATLQDTAYFAEYDETLTRANAAREAWGYRVRGANFTGDANMLRSQADAENPLLSAGLAAGGTLFSGGSGSVAAKWYRGSQGGGSQMFEGYGGRY
jgi:hypothetical protein